MSDANLIRSMSRKACSPDNAACERFFGWLKTELFYPRDWYNEKRIKISLGSLSPIEYRESLRLTAYNQSKFLSAPPLGQRWMEFNGRLLHLAKDFPADRTTQAQYS